MLALVIIAMLWVFVFMFNHPKCPIDRMPLKTSTFKTGDLILFHALDNLSALAIGTYYTHIGVVYCDETGQKLFEAVSPERELLVGDNRNGIVLCDLEQRLRTYRGYVFHKKVSLSVDEESKGHFRRFIDFAVRNLYYNTNILRNFINKVLFAEPIHRGVNCGELVYLSLICLGILPKKHFHENRKHHLQWLANLTDIYDEMKYIYYDPFSQFQVNRINYPDKDQSLHTECTSRRSACPTS